MTLAQIWKWIWGNPEGYKPEKRFFADEAERQRALDAYRHAYHGHEGFGYVHPNKVSDSQLHAFVVARRHSKCAEVHEPIYDMTIDRAEPLKRPRKKTGSKKVASKLAKVVSPNRKKKKSAR